MLLIYAWTTPGRYLWSNPWSPTDTGLQLGIEQLCRVLVTIASLQVVLTRMSKVDLFASIYILLTPLRYFNGAQARFAVRFALTLQLAEELLESKLDYHALLAQLMAPSARQLDEIEIRNVGLSSVQRWALRLQIVLIALTMGVGGFWL